MKWGPNLVKQKKARKRERPKEGVFGEGGPVYGKKLGAIGMLFVFFPQFDRLFS